MVLNLPCLPGLEAEVGAVGGSAGLCTLAYHCVVWKAGY